tara:strand:+ start:695 stop:808 length:114 start_codon:yes stop_codon:yes gene_type:complete
LVDFIKPIVFNEMAVFKFDFKVAYIPKIKKAKCTYHE